MKLMTKTMSKKMGKYVGKATMFISKHLPDILVFTGIAAGGATVVMACKETVKLDPVLDEAKDKIEDIHEIVAEADDRQLAIRDHRKDLTKVYAQTAVNVAKVYWPSVIMGGVSVACILSGHNIMKKRNVALAAAYTALDTTFKKYRKRVVDAYGEKVDSDFFHGTKTTQIVDSETGEVTEVSEYVDDPDDGLIIFGSDSPCWYQNPTYSEMLLKQTQQLGTDYLKASGFVWLDQLLTNELGIKPRDDKEAAKWHVIGWTLDENDPTHDNYVDLRFKPIQRRNENGNIETVFSLDPNTDGTILYKFRKGLN